MKKALLLITVLAFAWDLMAHPVPAQLHNSHMPVPVNMANPPALIERIKRSIRDRYGTDPANPTQETFFLERPSDGFLEALRGTQLIANEKAHDPTEDVCFIYEVKAGEDTWKIKLSGVGKFAVLMRVTLSKPLLIINRRPASGPPQKLFDVISAHRYELLNKPTLAIPLTLRISFLPGVRIKVYQALFTRREKLPWELR